MKIEPKRIFISDLPEATNEKEIQTLFKAYGKVTCIEVKTRKELGPKNKSLAFAYVNIETDNRTLQRCFQDFAETDWHGEYVQLQLAKENFLDRLKREREESTLNNVSVLNHSHSEDILTEIKDSLSEGSLRTETSKRASLSSFENTGASFDNTGVVSEQLVKSKKRKNQLILHNDDTELTDAVSNGTRLNQGTLDSKESCLESNEDPADIVIKNNKWKLGNKRKLKIEGTTNEPIAVVELKKPKLKKVVSESVPEIKRSESVKEKVKSYTERKSLIKKALSNVDCKTSKKIVFDDDGVPDTSTLNANSSEKFLQNSKKPLFDQSDEEQDEFQPNFQFKEQYEGTKGKKLLAMQSKFKNDARFAMDARFWEEDNNEDKNMLNSRYKGDEVDTQNTIEESVDEEKKKDLEILSQVLGQKAMSNSSHPQKSSIIKMMIRYDPNDENTSKLELKKTEPVVKKKKQKEPETILEKRQEEKQQPAVSKDIFYKVSQDLKDTIQNSTEGFSLLNMFGQPEDDEKDQKQEVVEPMQELPKSVSTLFAEKNPFKYDSSDEDETKDIPKDEPKRNNMNNHRLRTDSFFFKEDDYRFQDGLDFIKRIALKDTGDFVKIRQELKSIVRSKVRNNQRKNKPFKKKLGGNAKKKRLRIKKALQR